MNVNQAIGIYSKLFDPNASIDSEFYYLLYVTPVHELSLSSILVVNSESIPSTQFSVQNVSVMQDILSHGVDFLIDAMNCPLADLLNSESDFTSIPEEIQKLSIHHKQSNFNKANHGRRRSSSATDSDFVIENHTIPKVVILDEKFQDGEDITMMSNSENSSTQLPSTAISSLVDLNEEEDITQLNGQTVAGRRTSVTSLESNIGKETDSTPCKPNNLYGKVRKFQDLDDTLRIELLINILKILKIWLSSIVSANSLLKHAKSSIGLESNQDVCISILEYTQLNKKLNFSANTFSKLLYSLKWYLATYVDSISNFPVIREVINVFYNMIRTFYKTLLANPDREIVHGLFSKFYSIDCASELERVLISSESIPKQISVLNFTTSMELFCILGTLIKLPANYLKKFTLSADITILNTSLNIYESHFATLKYQTTEMKLQLVNKLITFLALDYQTMYKSSPDLLLNDLSSSSFLGWITGNRIGHTSGYLLYTTAETIATILNEIQFDHNDFNIQANEYYMFRLNKKSIGSEGANDEAIDRIPPSDFLQILLFLYCSITNTNFLEWFTEKFYPEEESDYHIELLEVWLAVLLYVASYRTETMRMSFLIASSILLKLTSSKTVVLENERTVDRLSQYQVNEFKWKLNHQRKPVVPVSSTQGSKSALLYILDILQVYMRFNLTRKFDTELYGLVNHVVYQIVEQFVNSGTSSNGKPARVDYEWLALFKTYFQKIRFIAKHIHTNDKKFSQEIKHVLEQTILILDICLLQPTIIDTYDLIYQMLLDLNYVEELMKKYDISEQLVPLVYACVEHLKKELEALTPGSVFDYGTPEFTQIVARFDGLELLPTQAKAFEYSKIFPIANTEIHSEVIEQGTLKKAIDMSLIKWDTLE